MSKTEYLLQISVAVTAAELHEITRTAAIDPALPATDYTFIRGEIGKRFAHLNAATVGTPKPRWT